MKADLRPNKNAKKSLKEPDAKKQLILAVLGLIFLIILMALIQGTHLPCGGI